MYRFGNILTALTIMLLVFSATSTVADDNPATCIPEIILPEDSTLRFCDVDSFCYDLVVTNPSDNDTLWLRLIEGPIDYPETVFYNDFTEHICFTPETQDVYRFIWQIENQYGQTDQDTVEFSVVFNVPPVIEDQYFSTEVCVTPHPRVLPVAAYDPDCDSLLYELVSGPGQIGPYTGIITYDADTTGVYEFVVAVFDECTSDTATIYDTVYVNQPPELLVKNYLFHLCEPEEICFDVIGRDPEGSPLNIHQMEGRGAFTKVSDTSGQTCFTPPNADSADYTFIYCLVDECPYEDSTYEKVGQTCLVDTIVVTVIIDQPPVIVCPDTKTFFTCDVDTFCFQVDAMDPEFSEITYSVLSSNATVDGKTICVIGDQADIFDVVIEAVDTCGHADTCTVVVEIQSNRPPYVTMADDFSMNLCQPETICFDASADDLDFDITQIDVNFGYYDTGTNRVCFDADTSGVYVITLTATDECGATDTDTTIVTIDMNQQPVVDLGDDFNTKLCAPEPICFDVTIADDNTELFVVTFGEYDEQTGQICFTPDTAGIYEIIARLFDACDAVVEDTIMVGVEYMTGPTVSGMPDSSLYLCYPQQICLPVDITDADDDIVEVVSNHGYYADGSVCFVPYDSGTFEIIVTATDACGNSDADTAYVTITTDQGIALECPGDTSIFLCEPDTLCFPIEGIPEGAEVTVGGTATWWDAETQSICFYSDCCLENILTVNATTKCGTYSCTFTVQVQTNTKPLVIIPQDTTIELCDPAEICLPVGIDDMDGNVVDVIVEGAVFDDYRDEMCFMPDTSGTYIISVSAVDDCGAVDTDQMTIVVELNEAPVAEFDRGTTLFRQCTFEEICLPVTVTDINDNLADVTVTHGVYDDQTGMVCFTPDAFGEVCITLVATDICGAADTTTICTMVEQGDFVSIDCPTDLPAVVMCFPGETGLPISITGDNYQVSTDFGEFIDGELRFFADTSGLYTITVIATSECNADTCLIEHSVIIQDPVTVTCPADTSVFLCEETTLAFEFNTTGNIDQIDVTEPAYIDGGMVYVPVTQAGVQTITITVSGFCGTDSCSFDITSAFNSAPTVKAKDTTTVQCELAEVCLPVMIGDVDDNIVDITSSVGTIVDGTLCFMPEAFGETEIVITVTDDCGAEAVDTVYVTVVEGDFVEITCPTVDPVLLCEPGPVCFDVPASGSGYQVYSDIGTWTDDQLCFDADTTGLYVITIIGDAGCNSDTCTVAVDVTVKQPVTVTCEIADSTIFFCDTPGHFMFPVTITGDDPNVTVNPETAWYEGGYVHFDVSQSGDYEFEVVVYNECNADTCGFVAHVEFNEPPVLIAGPDSTLTVCELTEICLPFELSDINDNIVEVRTSRGQVNDRVVCFTPDAFGEHEIVITAVDDCGETVKDTILVTVNEGSWAMIDCPDHTIQMNVATPDTVRIPIGVSPLDAVVTVAPYGYYDYATGEVVAYIETTGFHDFRVTAEAFCNIDTCDFTLQISQYFSPEVQCEGFIDTALCLIEPQEICSPVTISGTDVQVMVSPIGEYVDGHICVTVDQTGDYEIQIVAYNEFEADTCISMIHVDAGQPPTVTLPEDMQSFLCGPDEICVTPIVDTMDFGIQSAWTNIGTWNPETGDICFTADTVGTYMIVAGVSDSCGYEDVDTMYVEVTLNDTPIVNLGDDFSRLMCEPFLVCVDVEIIDANALSVATNIGDYDIDLNEVCFMVDTAGTYELIVSVTDKCGVVGADTLVVTVQGNTGPEITPMADTSVYLCYPQPICLATDIIDIDDNITDISVSRGSYSDGAVCFVPYDSGRYEIVLTVTDECGLTAVDTAVVYIHTDQGIALECPGDTSIFLCEPDTLCFPVYGIPEGAEVTIGGTAAWWDEDAQTVCFYSDCCLENVLTVNATTECGTYSCTFTVYVQTNTKPLVIIPQDTTILQCEPQQVCLPIGVSDMDGNLAEVTVEGADYDDYRNLLCLQTSEPGEYLISVTATDSCGAVDTDEMIVTVVQNSAPTAEFLETSTMHKQCEFAEICLPVETGDIDGNIESVIVSHGTYDSENNQVCFMPDSFGVYCITLTATDSCGLTGTDELCVEVIPGDYVQIDCPAEPIETDTLCEPGQVCHPLAVTGDNFEVTVDFGTWTDGTLCFQADTSGVYVIEVIATAMCEADTCLVTVPVEILEPVAITCPSGFEVFLCADSTFELDYTPSSSVTSVTASAPAYVDNGTVYVPVTQEGALTITMIAEGLCESDTCSFTIDADYNADPVLTLGPDTSLVECSLFEVCVPLTVSDEDDNLVEVLTTAGTISGDNTQLCYTPEAYGEYEIIVTAVDECGAADVDTVTISFLEGNYASIICPDDDQFVSLCEPETVCLVVPIEPADANITILPNGSYNPTTGQICVWVEEGGPMEITVIAEASCSSDTCEFILQVDMGIPPAITCPEQIDTLLCLAQLDTLVFPVEITGTGVEVNVNPAGWYSAGFVSVPIDEAGEYEIEIIAHGRCGVDTCYTNLVITADQLPELFLPMDMTFERCPDDTNLICIDGIYATDAESEVTLTQVCGQDGFEAVRADSGRFCFRPESFGTHEICIEADDGCNTVTESFFIDIITKEDCDVCVRVSFDPGECSPVGLRKVIALMIETNDAIAGFDVLFAYDASALTFVGATEDDTEIQDWEYFTYNTNNAACGTACPSGIVRLVGIADVNNGPVHPPESAYTPNGVMAYLEFQIANDQNLGDQFVPINWVWYDCGDNTFSDVSGTLLYMDLRILNPELGMIWDETDDINFPEAARPFGVGAPDECLEGTDKTQPLRCIEFVNGGLCIIHPDSIDDRGDINLDGLAYTIADAVLFTNYFIYGLNAFSISPAGQIAATDVNADGITLSVADLVYLIRVVVGDADPYPKPSPHPEALKISTLRGDGSVTITTESVDNIGAAHFIYDLDPSVSVDNVRPGSGASGMDLQYSIQEGQLRIVVYDIGTAVIPSGVNELIRVDYSGEGRIDLVHADAADYNGRPYKTTADLSLPTGFVLSQNYPNPFNPTTAIHFSLPYATDWSLKIYNIRGELVRVYDGSGDAGTVEVIWDGTTSGGEKTASGVYLYRLDAGDFNETRKMILLK